MEVTGNGGDRRDDRCSQVIGILVVWFGSWILVNTLKIGPLSHFDPVENLQALVDRDAVQPCQARQSIGSVIGDRTRTLRLERAAC